MASSSAITRRSLGLGLLTLSALSHAQTEPPLPASNKNYPPVEVVNTPLEYRQFDKVEVTGSSIIAKEAKEALPVQVISRQEIERSGATNLPQLLQKLPGMFNFQELGTMTGTREGGPETAAIHGNPTGTLVLLNGRRLPSYGSQAIILDRSMVDVNLVPLSAIERIEVMSDGASSRYGSDAVAGVVNIITKASTKGLGVSAEYTHPANGLAQGKMMGLSWGTGRVNEQGYRLQVHFSAQDQKALLANDVENARNAALPISINGQSVWASSKWITTHGWPAGIYNYETNTTTHPSIITTGKCPDNWYKSTTDDGKSGCFRNMQSGLTLYPSVEKQLLFIDGEVVLNSDWRGFGQFVAGRQTQRSVPLEGQGYYYDLGNNSEALIDTSPLGPLRQRYINSNKQVVAGVKGSMDGWDIRASASTGQHRVVRAYTNGLPISWAAFGAVELTSADLAQSADKFPPALLARYAAVKQTTEKLMDDGLTRLTTIDALASKEIGSTDDGPMALGLGWNLRNESVDYSAPNYPSTRPAFSASRHNWAVHAELQTPLNETQDVTLALRHDQYSDFGGVQTGKLGWRWRPHREFMARGSLGTGFRAPTLAQMQPVSTVLGDDSLGNMNFISINIGNPQLKPEQSTQATLGLRWDPSPHWTLGADLWQLNIRNTFGIYDAYQVMSSPTLRTMAFTSENDVNYLRLTNLNIGNSERQGIDYEIQLRKPTDMGRVRLALRGTWNLQARKQSIEGSFFESELGRYASNTLSYTPRHQWSLTASLERAAWSVMTALNYRSGFTNTMTTAPFIGGSETVTQTRVPGFWSLDIGGRWQPDRSWTLMANVQNLTNQYPPLMIVSSSYLLGVDTRYANYYGRTLKIKAEYKF
jgi:iron complex outermembrane receptor protein